MDDKKIEKAIEDLGNLKLSEYPINDIYRLISDFGEFGNIIVNYHPEKVIMRARPMYEEVRFTKISDLSYKPQKSNTTYQRASTPNKTMFYGCTISDKEEDNDKMNNRVIGVFESIPWLRDKTKKGVQKIAFGRWVVTETLNLIAIVYKKDFYDANSYTKELVDGFKEYLSKHPNLEDKTIMVSEFLANEFGKAHITNSSDYLISAIYTDIIISKGFDGVLFPSVRLEGKGFNVAITPEAVNQKLQLEVAGECIIYKNYDSMVMDNITNAIIEEGKEDFKLENVDPKYHAGEEECLKQLGLSTITELE